MICTFGYIFYNFNATDSLMTQAWPGLSMPKLATRPKAPALGSKFCLVSNCPVCDFDSSGGLLFLQFLRV